MPKGKLAFSFTSSLVRLDTALGRTSILPVSDEAAAAWKKAQIRRVLGTVNGHAVNRGLQRHADGGTYLTLGQDLVEAIGLKPRTVARIELSPDPKETEPEIPEELLVALAQDEKAQARWATFPQGKRRSLASYVTAAKQEPTRIKRALELTHKIGTHTLYGDRPASLVRPK